MTPRIQEKSHLVDFFNRGGPRASKAFQKRGFQVIEAEGEFSRPRRDFSSIAHKISLGRTIFSNSVGTPWKSAGGPGMFKKGGVWNEIEHVGLLVQMLDLRGRHVGLLVAMLDFWSR